MFRPAVQRIVALALVGLWVGLPAASALHDDDHAHRYCAEHGTVEEAGEALASVEAVPGDADPSGLHDVSPESGDVVHLPCAFGFVHGLGDGLEGAGLEPGRIQPSLGPVASLRSAAGGHGLSPLAVAPKSSPPARG